MQTAATAALDVARSQSSQAERELERERQQRSSTDAGMRQANAQLSQVMSIGPRSPCAITLPDQHTTQLSTWPDEPTDPGVKMYNRAPSVVFLARS